MHKYFATLDLLFRSEYLARDPMYLKEMMRGLLERRNNATSTADYIINLWKQERLIKENDPERIKVLKEL
jgi:hypothetical protein